MSLEFLFSGNILFYNDLFSASSSYLYKDHKNVALKIICHKRLKFFTFINLYFLYTLYFLFEKKCMTWKRSAFER